jgi:hypothetical protein
VSRALEYGRLSDATLALHANVRFDYPNEVGVMVDPDPAKIVYPPVREPTTDARGSAPALLTGWSTAAFA